MRITILLLLGLFAPLPAIANDFASIEAAEMQFSGLKFGQAAPPELRCIRGPCRGEETFVSIFKQPIDITLLGPIEISAPEYTFHQDRLFRIQFKLLCRNAKLQSCLAEAEKELDNRFDLSLIREWTEEGEEGGGHSRILLTRTGTVVSIDSGRVDGWNHPLVSIYDQKLMHAVRAAMNPNYVPQQLVSFQAGPLR